MWHQTALLGVKLAIFSDHVTTLGTPIPALFVERFLWTRKCEIRMSNNTLVESVTNVQFASRDWVQRRHLKIIVKFTVKQGPISVIYVANSLRHTLCLKHIRVYTLELRTTVVSFVIKRSEL